MAVPTCRERLRRLPDFGYRTDVDVPAFPDDKSVIVFDGVCVLCSGFARFVAERDGTRQFRFVAAQSRLGRALYGHAGLDPVNYETNLLLADGRFFGKMDAFVRIMTMIGGVYHLARVVNWLPHRWSDWLYDRIAQNRYRLFGLAETCIVPDARWRDRVLE